MKLPGGELGADSEYVPKTKEKIRQLALDNMAGSVFGSWQMSQNDLNHAHLVFLPLAFADDFLIKSLLRDQVVHVYGHLSNALNRAINGMPIFHSFSVIDANDLERVFKMQRLIEQLEEPE